MGATITFPHSETGVTLYALVFHTDGKVRDVVAPAWDTYATADLGDYDVALTELGTASRIYQFSVPASVAAGAYSFAIYKRAGGSPAEGDLRVGMGSFDYDGSAIVGVGEGVNVEKWLGTAAATPTVAGVPEVDLTHIAGSAVDTGSAQLGVRMVTASDAAGQQVAFQVWEEPISSHSTITLYGGYIEARLDNINTNASSTVTRLGTPSDLGSGATVAGNLVDIESQTDDIGVAGAGLTEAGGTGDHLTAIPWNASWDAQVQSEVEDGLAAYGASTHSAADVWAAATRTLTAIDEDSTTLDLDATIRAAVGLASADLDSQLAALPTAAENADAVWDENTTGHVTSGTFGEQLKTDVDAILLDTGTDGVVIATGAITAAVIATDAIDSDALAASAITEIQAGLSTLTAAQVNGEMVDALATDTYAEPASVPAATSSLKDKISWVFTLARNKITETSTTQTLRNDADSSSVATATVADDGTTFTRAEWT